MFRVVFCEAYKSGLYGDKIQWLIVGGYTAHWWTRAREHGQHLECSPAEVNLKYFICNHILGIRLGMTSV